MKNKFILYYKHIFEFIELFEVPKTGHFIDTKFGLKDIRANFQLDNKRFTISFSSDSIMEQIESGSSLKNINFLTDVQLKFQELFITDDLFEASEKGRFFSYRGKISKLWSKNLNFKTKYYFRLAIPINEKNDLFFKVEDQSFDSDMTHSRRGTSLTINNSLYTIHYLSKKDTNQNLLIISSSSKSNFNIFSNQAYSILIAGLSYKKFTIPKFIKSY